MSGRRGELVARRKARGYTRESLAAVLGVTVDAVRGWERGQWDPAASRRGDVARALGWTVEQLDEALRAGTETPAAPHVSSEAVDRAGADHRVWARKVDPDQALAYFTEQWHAQVKADNVIGPHHALQGVRQHIPLLTTLIDHGPDSARRPAVRLAAQYAESASWLHEDLGELTTARHWADQALRLARTGNDRDLITWTHFRRAAQCLSPASTHPSPYTAHSVLERLARAHDEGTPQPSMRAALDTQHALALASLGHESSAHRLLDRAQDYADDRDSGDARGGHGSFASPEWVGLQRAWCWTILGRPTKAVPLFEMSLKQLPTVYQRDRAAHLVRFAATLRDAGHIDTAARHALQAWNLAHAVDSGRCTAQVRDLAASLRAHRRVDAVEELLTTTTVGDH